VEGQLLSEQVGHLLGRAITQACGRFLEALKSEGE